MEFKENNKAIFMQIADKICDDITKGAYAPGERIPSVRDYAAAVIVNANTVMRAYDYLSQQGIIVNRRGIGYFVADNAAKIISDQLAKDFFNTELKYVFTRLDAMGISPDLLKLYYQKYLSEKK